MRHDGAGDQLKSSQVIQEYALMLSVHVLSDVVIAVKPRHACNTELCM
jgi:hypothetical protein